MTIPWPFILFDGCLGGAIAALVDKMLLVSLRRCCSRRLDMGRNKHKR